MGGTKFNDLKQCGTRCKNWGQWLQCHEEIVKMAKEQFFPDFNTDTDEDRYEYFLANPQGSKLMNSIAGKPWSLAQYIHVHGYYHQKLEFTVSRYVCEQETHAGSKKDSMGANVDDKPPLVIEVVSDHESVPAAVNPSDKILPRYVTDLLLIC